MIFCGLKGEKYSIKSKGFVAFERDILYQQLVQQNNLFESIVGKGYFEVMMGLLSPIDI